VRMEFSKLESENAHVREQIVKDKESAAKQLARCKADADEVIQQLRRTVVQLEGQLKQQVGFNFMSANMCPACKFTWSHTRLFRKLRC
jgi:signal transduction histidine kinase